MIKWIKKLLGIPTENSKSLPSEMVVEAGGMKILVRQEPHIVDSMGFKLEATFEVVGMDVSDPTISVYLAGARLSSANDEATSLMKMSDSDQIKVLIGSLLTAGGAYVSAAGSPTVVKDPNAKSTEDAVPSGGKYSN